MALQHTALVDLVEVGYEDSVRVRMKKIVMEDANILGWSFHRFIIGCGTEQEPIYKAVSDHMVAMGFARPTDDQWDLVRPVVAAIHTPEAIDATALRDALLNDGAAPQDHLDRTVFFQTSATDYVTPADPEGRVDCMVTSRTLQFIEGIEPQRLGVVQMPPGSDILQIRQDVDAALTATVGQPVRDEDWVKAEKVFVISQDRAGTGRSERPGRRR